MKRKGKGKRCLACQRVARADRAQLMIAAWQADASGDGGDVVARLEALRQAWPMLHRSNCGRTGD